MRRILVFLMAFLCSAINVCHAFDFSVTSSIASPGPSYIESAQWQRDVLVINMLYVQLGGGESFWNVHLKGDQLELDLNFRAHSKGPIPRLALGMRDTIEIRDLKKKDYSIVYKIMASKKDSMILKTDNSVLDKCNDNPNYECYLGGTKMGTPIEHKTANGTILTDSIYQLLKSFHCQDMINADMDPQTNTIKGFGYCFSSTKNEKGYMMIHNRRFRKPIEMEFLIDLADNKLYQIEMGQKGMFERQKFNGLGVITCSDGRQIKGEFTNGKYVGNNGCN